jgi:hypothetical protein
MTPPPLASVAISVLALLVGGFNLWYSVIRPWRRSRWANPAATLELLSYQTSNGWATDQRIVVTNVGEASMKDITASVRDQDGGEFTENMTSLWPRLPVPVLYKGQSLHFKFDHFELPTPGSIVVRWRDGRRNEQEREIWLSYQRIA